jgi:glycine/D-amino acid oxidase-like deaminating enzyme/nitrite reductase/ring-hydroxylating ferredoxin subunit
VLDDRYFDLESDFGEEGARLIAESKASAIDRIETFVRQLGVECGFERVPGYLFAETRRSVRELKRELKAARAAGFAVELVRDTPLPGPMIRAALRFENQAQFDPAPYIEALAERIDGDGSRIFEDTHVTAIEDGAPCRLSTGRGLVIARDVIVATDSPVSNRFVLHTKLAAYRTYVIAARARKPEEVSGLFWDTQDPYHYVRLCGETAIIGGEDHKTGMDSDPSHRFAALEAWARDRISLGDVAYRWSGQVMEPVDGLPYIGRNPLSKHVYVATGFAGNGMTYGTLSGMILSDLVRGAQNRFAELYDPSRKKPLASMRTFVSENKDFPMCFVSDRLAAPEAQTLSEVPQGEGRIMKAGGKKVAVYREPTGSVRACSAVCPHMGCLVRWNNSENSWDCPCHGSRFDTDGRVLHGPATSALEAVALEELQDAGKKTAA